MFHDPIVEEVRAIREKLAAQFNFDLRKIVEDAQRRQAASKSKIVSFEPRRINVHALTKPDTVEPDHIAIQQTNPTPEA